MADIDVVVNEVRALTPGIRELVLAAADGAALPSWQPGAHIGIEVPGEDGATALRAFSLIGGCEAGDDPDTVYRIAVERKAESRGGSHFLHDQVAVGTQLSIAAPKNEFQLHLHPAERVLIAGGIGIVPIYAMARVLVQRAVPFALHYAGPDAAEMAYRAELERLVGAHAHFHYDGGRLDCDPIFEPMGYPAEIYVCGQRPFNQAVVASAMEHGLSRMQIMQQCFDPPPPPVPSDNVAFEVELRRSGIVAQVPPDTSILETLLAAGYPAQFYCGRGECGFCPLPVLEADGPIDHRDHFLQPEERNEQMCVCVSRLKGTRLVLDA